MNDIFENLYIVQKFAGGRYFAMDVLLLPLDMRLILNIILLKNPCVIVKRLNKQENNE